jgi:hypothetical protein
MWLFSVPNNRSCAGKNTARRTGSVGMGATQQMHARNGHCSHGLFSGFRGAGFSSSSTSAMQQEDVQQVIPSSHVAVISSHTIMVHGTTGTNSVCTTSHSASMRICKQGTGTLGILGSHHQPSIIRYVQRAACPARGFAERVRNVWGRAS